MQAHLSAPRPPAWAFEQGCLWVLDSPIPGPYRAHHEPGAPAGIFEIHRDGAGLLARAIAASGPEHFLRRFSTGRRCFVASLAGEIAAYGWVSQSPECIGELERQIQIEADEAYIWDCFTLPAYRRQGLYTSLLAQITTGLFAEGVRRVWIGSSWSNRPSIRGFVHTGFQPVLNVIYARLSWLSGMLAYRASGAPQELARLALNKVVSGHEHLLGPLAIAARPPVSPSACYSLLNFDE
jgi:GNAT superfamily N-acetyltransferase